MIFKSQIIEKYPGLREVFIFLTLLLVYQVSRALAIGEASVAFENAYRLIEAEKFLGIFNELQFQQWFMNKTGLLKALNTFYIRAHLPVTIIFFVWLYKLHKNYYFGLRNTFILANLIAIFFYVFYPCAPPRMLNELGFVDTLLELSKVNLYKGALSKTFNQYAAVPSMHFGYSLFIGIVTCTLGKNIFAKIFAILYPILVLTVIVATANHFWLDAIIGGLVILFSFFIVKQFQKKESLKVMPSPFFKSV